MATVSKPGGFRLQEFEEVTSTNDVIKKAIADGEPEMLAVSARAQTKGYGRRGNAWSSKPGSVYLSLLLRPDVPIDEISTLGLAAAIAVHQAITGFLTGDVADAVKIKWPNDVVVMDDDDALVPERPYRKICGISVEQKMGAVCLGIGLNVHKPENASLKNEITGNRPVYLHDLIDGECATGVSEVRDRLLGVLSGVYHEWQAEGFASLHERFSAHSALDGKRIRVESPDGSVLMGVAMGVTDQGRLLINADETNLPREITTGTVTIVG